MDAVFSMIDIVPYLDVETASLSSVVYWPGLLAGSRLLAAAVGGNAEAAAISRIVFSDLVHIGTDEMILQVIRARLSFRSKGYVDADHPGYENDGGARIRGIMIRESAAKGMQLETWLRPAAVEHLFRLRLGAEYNVIERGLRGLESAQEVSRVRALV
ncbi:hypothetical protein VDGE_30209 [Verticillium dahliae]|uniref:Uncharacterized protein n=1 Tax=Verticillium dahliae TaxID=27337 RepID=A0A444RN90_VERDA|nr:hypothetical protein VDGE_30209 [Verticillium dahliae]